MFKPGDAVQLRRGAINGYPVTTVVQIDEGTRKAQIRFARAVGTGYSYLFWRDLADIEGGETDGRTPTEV